MDVRKELFENQDLKYKEFQSKLVPNISEEKIIGVRMPVLRKMAKKAKVENADFSTDYYDELLLKAMIIGLKKCSVSEHLDDLKAFVPLIDNWAVCDCCCSTYKFMKKDQEEWFSFLKTYEASAGGGVVTAVVTGKRELKSLEIDPDAVDPEDVEMLQDLIVAAVNEAMRAAESDAANTMQKLTGG